MKWILYTDRNINNNNVFFLRFSRLQYKQLKFKLFW